VEALRKGGRPDLAERLEQLSARGKGAEEPAAELPPEDQWWLPADDDGQGDAEEPSAAGGEQQEPSAAGGDGDQKFWEEAWEPGFDDGPRRSAPGPEGDGMLRPTVTLGHDRGAKGQPKGAGKSRGQKGGRGDWDMAPRDFDKAAPIGASPRVVAPPRGNRGERRAEDPESLLQFQRAIRKGGKDGKDGSRKGGGKDGFRPGKEGGKWDRREGGKGERKDGGKRDRKDSGKGDAKGERRNQLQEVGPDGRKICIFFSRGICRNGANCQFSHAGMVSVEAGPLDAATVDEIRTYLQDNGGAVEGGKLSLAFKGVKRSQLEEHFLVVGEGNGKFRVVGSRLD